MTDHFYHSHQIVEERCKGRMKCLHVCPTKAIRVRNGKATFITELCIDCGECINACPENAFIPISDDIEDISFFKYQIAIPSPVLYAQFNPEIHPGIVHQALKNIGFNEVVDVYNMTNELGFAIPHHFKTHSFPKPLIISYCPTIIRLIQVSYPNLVNLISPFDVPREIIAKEIKKTYPKKLGLKEDEIGVIYITPCPSKIVSIKQPAEKERSWIDSAIPIKDIYNLILPQILEIQKQENIEELKDFQYGSGWIALENISEKLGTERCLSVSGLDHVRMIFDDIENSKLRNIDFIEALACIEECLGGPFCVENPYIARHNSILLKKQYGHKQPFDKEKILNKYKKGFYSLEHSVLPRPIKYFDHDIATSVKRMRQKERILMKLPQKDCGLCGSPTCATFAEDCARGDVDITDCIFFSEKFKS